VLNTFFHDRVLETVIQPTSLGPIETHRYYRIWREILG